MHFKSKEILEKLAPIRKKLLAEYYSDTEYKELVMAMGINEWEWERLQEAFPNYIARSEKFLQHGLPKDAIQELQQAQLMAPNDLNLHLLFSQAYLQNWKQHRKKEDENACEYHAKRALNISAESDLAVKILAQLQKPVNRTTTITPPTVHRSKSQRSKAFSIGIALAFVGIAVISTVAYNAMKEIKVGPEENITVEQEGVEEVEVEPAQIPVEFENVVDYDGLEFKVQQSVLTDYKGSYSYTLEAYAVSKEEEIEHMELDYRLVDDNGTPLKTGKAYVSFKEGMRAGDLIPMFTIVHEAKKAPKLQKVVYTIKKAKMRAAAAAYPQAPKIEAVWQVRKTKKLDVNIYERFSEIKYNSYSKDVLHSFTFLIENKGSKALKKIKTKLTWYDAQGKKLGEGTTDLIGSGQPHLQPAVAVPYHKVIGLNIGNTPSQGIRYQLEIMDASY